AGSFPGFSAAAAPIPQAAIAAPASITAALVVAMSGPLTDLNPENEIICSSIWRTVGKGAPRLTRVVTARAQPSSLFGRLMSTIPRTSDSVEFSGVVSHIRRIFQGLKV